MGYTTLPKHATKTTKLEFGIRKIIEIDMPVDWEWYENAIIDLIDKLEIRLLEGADFDVLNARKITDNQISDWVQFNTELPQERERTYQSPNDIMDEIHKMFNVNFDKKF